MKTDTVLRLRDTIWNEVRVTLLIGHNWVDLDSSFSLKTGAYTDSETYGLIHF
jgi:hypothetical protein